MSGKKILERFSKAKAKRQEKDALWKDLDMFDRGEQWKNSTLPAWIPKPVTNFIHLVKTTKRAALAMENPTGQLSPQSPEDVENVDSLQRVYEFVWNKIHARKVVRQNIETSKLLGTGIAQVYWDENVISGGTGGLAEGEIKIKEIDPASFYPDPNAFDIEDCEYIHVVERKSLEWLKKHPVFGEKMKGVEERQNGANDRGEIYDRSYNISSNGLVDFHQHYEKVQNKEGGFTYKVTYLAGEKVIHEIKQLEPNCYPFAVLYDFPQRHDFWGKSTCELILDNQKLINKVEGIIAMIGTLLQNPQKVVSKSSGINPREAAKFSNAPGHVWVANGDPSKAMHWQTPPQIPTTLMNLVEQAKGNIREITGLTEAYMGQTVGSMQTSTGVNSLIERSTMRDRDQMYDVELYLEQLSRIIINFITTKYSEPRYMRILGEDGGSPTFMQFVGTKYSDLEFDFNIDISAKAPITRARQREELNQLMTIQGQYGLEPRLITPQEFIERNDFVDSDRILKRMNMEEIQGKTEQLTQVANMMHEAMMNNIPPEEVNKMATSMIEQMESGEGIGSANTSDIHSKQQGL